MGGCLTPEKKAFPSREAAIVGAHAIGKGHLSPYLCSCAQWHLTSRRNTADEVPEEMVQLLAESPDKEFTSLVRAEIYGKATAEEAAALRSPELLYRWASALKAIAGDMQSKMEAAANRDDPTTRRWRQQHQRRILAVAARRKEARQLLSEVDRQRRQRLTGRDRRAEARAAGQRAIDRLIETHREEFEAYLAEEKAKDSADTGSISPEA